jgi:hypothetical protein
MVLDRIRPSIRLLCGGVGAVLLSGALVYFRAYGLVGAAPLGLLAGAFLAIGSTGSLEDGEPGPAASDEPAAPEPIRELADTARAVPPDLFRPAPARNPARRRP